jgi:hypothetical protein
MRYSINLVRSARIAEKKEEAKRVIQLGFSVICFGLLGVAFLFAALSVISMNTILKNEEKELSRLEAEYKKYTATSMFVNKADLELLDRLQQDRIFWTKKLAAIAYYLPNNYWIVKFGYRFGDFAASGYGYITPEQKQVMVLNNYFNKLRMDENYNDVFKSTYFVSSKRMDEEGKERVSFDFTSSRKKDPVQ